jgi:hypothetical protein
MWYLTSLEDLVELWQVGNLQQRLVREAGLGRQKKLLEGGVENMFCTTSAVRTGIGNYSEHTLKSVRYNTNCINNAIYALMRV